MHDPTPQTRAQAKRRSGARTVALRVKPATRAGRLAAASLALVALTGTAVATLGDGDTASAAPTTYSIWSGSTVPKTPAENDTASVELGTRFTTKTAGWVTGVRYYKSARNGGTKVGKLWDSSGRLLAQVTFAGESGSGWQQARLNTPVALKPGSNYVVSYQAPQGHYANDQYALSGRKPTVTYALTATQGVYTYDSGMPKQTWRDSNYFVDVVFTTVRPTTPTPPTTSTSKPTTTASTVAPKPTASTTTAAPKPTTSTNTTVRPKPTSTTSTPTTKVGPTPTSSTTTTTPKPTTSTTTPSSGGTVVLGRSFPNAATTGVSPGTALTNYTGPCSIQTDNVTIDKKTINCDLRILAQNVTIKNSIINGTIYSDPDYFNGSFTLTDSEVRMPQSSGTGIGDVNFVVTRVEVTGGSRSINCAANCTVQDSYLHGQYTDKRGIDHESAIRMGANSVIQHNTITCDATPVPPDAGCSAALTGYGDFAIVQKNTIDNNLIDGGPYGSMGYCAYGGSTTGKPYSNGVNSIRFTNNVFMRGPNGKCGIWGPITSFDSSAPGNIWSNNVWNDGKPVPPAN